MTSSVPSYVNFQSFGSDGCLTQYTDGSFPTAWTEFSASGAAYVYGRIFKPDGSTLRDTFLIASDDASVHAIYSEVTATTLSDGRTVVAWTKSDSSGKSVVEKVLSAGQAQPGELLPLSEGFSSAEAPQVYATQGGFGLALRGTYQNGTETLDGAFAFSLAPTSGGWEIADADYLSGIPNDPSTSMVILGSGVVD
ncbi:hypothetical protein [Microvirga roseola]|uniref:hypothetical protein n=1 Tax=Microvirga roseola TaxID=2883126 RepID=UPI001E52196D|nr:hypothetical protein [Microvirga roseola]